MLGEAWNGPVENPGFGANPCILVSYCRFNVLATRSSHLPIAIQITHFNAFYLFLHHDHGLYGHRIADLNQEDRMALTIAHLRANPNQSIQQVAKIFWLLRITLLTLFKRLYIKLSNFISLVKVFSYWRGLFS